MALNEWMLAALLAVAGGMIANGAFIVHDALGWVVAGLVVAGIAYLTLVDDGVEAAPADDADDS